MKGIFLKIFMEFRRKLLGIRKGNWKWIFEGWMGLWQAETG